MTPVIHSLATTITSTSFSLGASTSTGTITSTSFSLGASTSTATTVLDDVTTTDDELVFVSCTFAADCFSGEKGFDIDTLQTVETCVSSCACGAAEAEDAIAACGSPEQCEAVYGSGR